MKLRDIYANYHKYTYAQLLKEFPGIDWTMMFWVSGCPSFDEIVVQQPEPIPTARRSMASRLSERISETMADCMWHCVPCTMIRALQATSTSGTLPSTLRNPTRFSFQRISVQEFGNNKTTEPVTLVPWFFLYAFSCY